MQAIDASRRPSPRVSAVIIFLNGEAFLAEAIESIIAQTYKDWELFLVDDGSGPAATAIANEYVARYPNQIFYLDHPNHANRGMSATRNLGVSHARGEYIAFLDADDTWLPDKLADHVALLDAHPEVGLVCGATAYWWSETDRPDEVVQTGHRQNAVINPPEAALFNSPWELARRLPCPTSSCEPMCLDAWVVPRKRLRVTMRAERFSQRSS